MSVRVQAWLIVGVLVSAVFVSNPYAFLPSPDRQSGQPKPDFLAFYAAGTLLRENPSKLYDEQAQAEVQSAALGEPMTPAHPGFLPFVYPAASALLFVPLALLPYPAAFIAMLALNVLLYGIALDLLCRKLQLSAGASRLVVLSSALSIPVILTVANGQVSFLTFLILLMIVGDLRAHNPRTGVWTGFLAFKPTLMPVFLLRFVIKREWKSLIYTAITASVVLLVSFLIVGAPAMGQYWDMSLKMADGQYSTANTTHMMNVRSIAEFLGVGSMGGLLLSAVVLGFAVVKGTETSLVLAALLAAPHLHYQDLNPVWIVVAIGIGSLPSLNRLWRWSIFGGTLLITFTVFALASSGSALPILPVGLLVAFIVLTLRTWTRTQVPEQAPTGG